MGEHSGDAARGIVLTLSRFPTRSETRFATRYATVG